MKLSHEILLALAYVSQISDPDAVKARFIESLNGIDEGFAFEFHDRPPPGMPAERVMPIATLRSSFGYAVVTNTPEIPESRQAVFRSAFQFLAVLLENRLQSLALASKNETLLREIKREQSLVRTVLDTLPVGVWVADGNGTILSANAASASICIAPQGAAWRSGSGTPITPEEWGINRAIQAGETVTDQEIDIACPDGTQKTLLHSAAPLLDEEGNIIGAVGVNQNITERKKAEDALRASEQKFKHVFEAANAGKSITSVTGGLDANKAFCDLLGYAPEELRHKTWQEITPPEEVETIQNLIAPLLKGEKDAARFNKRYIRKNGSLIWADVSIAMERDADGKPANYIATIVDITDRKRAEEEKEKLQAQLIQAQKMESVGRLAGGVAHDYNNMLSIIMGYAELAMEKVPSGHPLAADIREILTAAKRSTEITRQLLAFARRQTTHPKVLNLNDSVEGTLKMLRRLIGEDIDLAWLPGADPWLVQIDPSQVDQILANLCVNARDAIEGVGKITIATRNVTLDAGYAPSHAGFVPGEYVLLTVGDDGIGMAPETLDNIFEPFFTTKGVGKGTGLGLATVYGIVRQNNGFIDVWSKLTQGTTIRIYLPRHPARAVPQHRESRPEIPLGRGETVLLVEDDRSILKLGQKMLESLGYHVLTAAAPSQAIRLAETHAGGIRLLITDVVMPEMNGRLLSEQLQRRLPDLKTLFMSGYTADVIAHRGVLEEGVCFIQKPFSKKDMAAKVREALDTFSA